MMKRTLQTIIPSITRQVVDREAAVFRNVKHVSRFYSTIDTNESSELSAIDMVVQTWKKENMPDYQDKVQTSKNDIQPHQIVSTDKFYISLKLLKDDIESSLEFFRKRADEASCREILTPASVALLLRGLFDAGRLETALEIYQYAYEENNDVPIDVFIANLVLRICSKMNSSTHNMADATMSLLHRLLQDHIILHHSTLAIAFKILIAEDRNDLVMMLESTMRGHRVMHNSTTRQAMVIAYSNAENYDAVFRIYHDVIQARIMPSAIIMTKVIEILRQIEEHAIAVRIVYIYVMQSGKMDWKLIEAIQPLLHPYIKLTSRKMLPYKMLPPARVSHENVDYKTNHLDYLNDMIIDMNVDFNENVYLYHEKRRFLSEQISRWMMNTMAPSTSSKSHHHPLIPESILYKMAPHIAVQGGLDKLIPYIKQHHIFPSDFWIVMMEHLTDAYPKDWRVALQVWERMRGDIHVTAKHLLSGLSLVVMVMIRASCIVEATSIVQQELLILRHLWTKEYLRDEIVSKIPGNMKKSEQLSSMLTMLGAPLPVNRKDAPATSKIGDKGMERKVGKRKVDREDELKSVAKE